MKTDTGYYVEWRIENFTHWCADVHGQCIRSPGFFVTHCDYMELYPKGISGQGEHLVVRLCGVQNFSTDELSFHSSTGPLLLCSKQPVNADGENKVVELPPGPKFEDVLSGIREGEDYITMRCWFKNPRYNKQYMHSTINVFKQTLKINPSWIENMKSDATIVFGIQKDDFKGLWITTYFEIDNVQFRIEPLLNIKNPFAVEMCMSLTTSDGTVDRCVKKEHVFRDKSPWIFPDPLKKEELAEKRISLILELKITTGKVIWSNSLNYNYKGVNLVTKNTFFPPEGVGHTEVGPPIGPFNRNNDSVTALAEDLMCLYQDQDLSDITLKCENLTFSVHRAILSARSPVFKTMLSSDMKEAASGEVVIGDLDPSTLSRFLTYLYTGAVEEDLLCESALKLYYAADKYQVPSLKMECSKFLCVNISLSTVCDILSLADRHNDDNLTTVSRNFILNHYNEVLGSKEWKNLMTREPVLIAKTLTYFGENGFLGKRNPE